MELVIRNCKFAYACPQTWEALEKTGKDDVRHCHECDKDVFLCEDGNALLDAMRFDRCVAVKGKMPDKTGRMLLGVPSSKYVSFEYRDDL